MAEVTPALQTSFHHNVDSQYSALALLIKNAHAKDQNHHVLIQKEGKVYIAEPRGRFSARLRFQGKLEERRSQEVKAVHAFSNALTQKFCPIQARVVAQFDQNEGRLAPPERKMTREARRSAVEDRLERQREKLEGLIEQGLKKDFDWKVQVTVKEAYDLVLQLEQQASCSPERQIQRMQTLNTFKGKPKIAKIFADASAAIDAVRGRSQDKEAVIKRIQNDSEFIEHHFLSGPWQNFEGAVLEQEVALTYLNYWGEKLREAMKPQGILSGELAKQEVNGILQELEEEKANIAGNRQWLESISWIKLLEGKAASQVRQVHQFHQKLQEKKEGLQALQEAWPSYCDRPESDGSRKTCIDNTRRLFVEDPGGLPKEVVNDLVVIMILNQRITQEATPQEVFDFLFIDMAEAKEEPLFSSFQSGVWRVREGSVQPVSVLEREPSLSLSASSEASSDFEGFSVESKEAIQALPDDEASASGSEAEEII